MRLELVKCHGSGNDFPLIDARGSAVPRGRWPRIARALADRAGPVGGDGLLLLGEASDPSCDFAMTMFNADGSEAENCLNGLRCVARMGFAAFDRTAARVRLKTSVAQVSRAPDMAAGVYTVEETAGPVSLDVSAWPLHSVADRIVEAPIAQLGEPRFTAVAIGNPHLVAFVASVDQAELVRVGRLCEAAPPWLPNRANVSFVEHSGDTLFVRTFERGVGLTDSCGSAMAASAYAAALTGRTGWDRRITVFNRGGRVTAGATADGMVTLHGNATFEWRGTIAVGADEVGDLCVIERYPDEIAAWDRAVAGQDTVSRSD